MSRWAGPDSKLLESGSGDIGKRGLGVDLNGDDMATMNGTIKTLTGKGFGFIAATDGQEYFFHQSACQDMPFDQLREGQAVTFERGQGPKGPRAENVRRA
jgi:CspA family cold shock protein